MLVSVFLEHPTGLPFALLAGESEERPAPLQPLPVEGEGDLPLSERFGGVVLFRIPGAAVPDDDGAPAIFALRDVPFKRRIFNWMIFDLHGQPFVCGVKRRPFGNSPGFEGAVEFQTEIKVQSSGGVLLYHEGMHAFDSANPARWLWSDTEVALAFVFGERGGPTAHIQSLPAAGAQLARDISDHDPHLLDAGFEFLG